MHVIIIKCKDCEGAIRMKIDDRQDMQVSNQQVQVGLGECMSDEVLSCDCTLVCQLVYHFIYI